MKKVADRVLKGSSGIAIAEMQEEHADPCLQKEVQQKACKYTCHKDASFIANYFQHS